MDEPFETYAIVDCYNMLNVPDKVAGRSAINLGAADFRVRLSRLADFADVQAETFGKDVNIADVV